MTDDVTSGSATARLTHPERVYVGWRYAQAHPDPGPPPRRPQTPGIEPVQQSWLMAHHGGQNLLDRPLKITSGGAGAGALLILLLAATGVLPWPFAGLALLGCGCIIAITGYSLVQGERAVRARTKQERARVERERADRRRKLDAAHEEHAAAYENWERRRQAYENQQEWYPVAVPSGVDRVDVVGGTLAGWSAAVTMMGAARLSAGGRVTVVDLSEGAVAQDLVRLAADHGEDPLVWVLPSDLPRLDVTRNLGGEALADVLSLVVSASEEQSSTRDLSFDNSILERIIAVFGGTATIPQITAALRALAQVGDPRDDLRLGLITDAQLDRVTTLFGRDASDRIVIRRAWALEAQLRKLDAIGSDPVRLPYARLHVVSMDRRAGVLTNRVLGTYVATALTHRIREAPPGGRWEHTLFLCGGEKLRGDVLDRLIDACESTGTGLVLMYRSIPRHVRERLGRRGHAAVGFMRLGNAEDARVAAEHIGTDQPLQVAEITDSAGAALAETAGEPYASTVVYARDEDPLTEPVSPLAGRHRSAASEAGDHRETAALVAGIRASTAWARSIPATEERKQRSRELLVEPHQLQELPTTAMIFTHTATGRRVQLVDANPGIMTLPTAHRMEYEEFLREEADQADQADQADEADEADQADQERHAAVERAALEEAPPPTREPRHARGRADPRTQDAGQAGDPAGTPRQDGERESRQARESTPAPEPGPSRDAGGDVGEPDDAREAAEEPGSRSTARPSRAKHAQPRGAGPRTPPSSAPLKPTGKHAANGRRADPRPPGEPAEEGDAAPGDN